MRETQSDKFKPGDIAIPLEDVHFVDNTKHLKGQKLLVTNETVSYFNVWHHIYDRIGT